MALQQQDTDVQSHYDIEDLPFGQPETELEIYNEDRDKLALRSQTLFQTIGEMGTRLAQADATAESLQQWAYGNEPVIKELTFIRSTLEKAWNNFSGTKNIIQRYGALDLNTQAIINTQVQQIENLADELEKIQAAIDDGDTLNHNIKPLVDVLREAVDLDQLLLGRQAEQLETVGNIAHYLRVKFEVEEYSMASRLFVLVQGLLENDVHDKITDAERDAFTKLIEAMKDADS